MSTVRITKRHIYYFFVFYNYGCAMHFWGHFTSNYTKSNRLYNYFIDILIAPLNAWWELLDLGYSSFALLIIMCAYYLNEKKKTTSFYSFGLAFFLLPIWYLVFKYIISPLTNYPLKFYFHSKEKFIAYTFAIVFTSLLMIPIHNYFRKKFDFLNEAE